MNTTTPLISDAQPSDTAVSPSPRKDGVVAAGSFSPPEGESVATQDLTSAEADLLAMCEETIEHGLQTFVEVGKALMQIRDARLYREYGTFDSYCSTRFNISRTRMYELMGAAEVVSAIADKIAVPPPSNEAQARELAKVPEAERADVWTKVHADTDGKPTAAAVRNAANPQTPDAPMSVNDTETAPPALGVDVPSRLGVGDEDVTSTAGGALASRTDVPPAVEPTPRRGPIDERNVWTPEQRREHEASVRRIQDIEAARHAANTIATETLSAASTIVVGYQYGITGLVTEEMLSSLRKAVGLLEGVL